MSKGDAAHAAQHTHGVVPRVEPLAPQTVEQRLAKLEQRVSALENQKPADPPAEVVEE